MLRHKLAIPSCSGTVQRRTLLDSSRAVAAASGARIAAVCCFRVKHATRLSGFSATTTNKVAGLCRNSSTCAVTASSSGTLGLRSSRPVALHALPAGSSDDQPAGVQVPRAQQQAQPRQARQPAEQQQQQQQKKINKKKAAESAGSRAASAQQPRQQQQPPQQQSQYSRRKQTLLQHGQQQQQQLLLQARPPAAGQLRQQLMLLLQQAQAQSAPPSKAGLRAAAAGSTDLLLSLLYSQLPLMLGSSSSSSSSSGQQRIPPNRQRALLREALVCVAWHCSTHRLLPNEAQRLQQLLLGQLLPVLAPHLASTSRKVLARAVFALGSCWACSWHQQQQQGSTTPQQEQQQAQYSSDSAARAEQAGAQVSQQQQQQWPSSSADWVVLLLRRLPPHKLSPGALLAALQGAAMHEVQPSQQWLQQASRAAYSFLESGKLDFNDAAAFIQACAALDYCPPAWMMHALVRRLQQMLPMLNPADLSGVLAALQALGFRPTDTWLRLWCEHSSRLLRGMTAEQLAAAAGALVWASYSPAPWWGERLYAASWPLLPVASADDLLLLLDAALGLRLPPPQPWTHQVYCHLRDVRRTLTLSQVADAAHVLAGLQLHPRLAGHHRTWLAACLRSSSSSTQVQGVAAMGRAELLYALYAAGKLRVRPQPQWLAAAMRRLAALLPGAAPAELVGSFVVFAGFGRQLQQQQQEDASQHMELQPKQQQQQQEDGPPQVVEPEQLQPRQRKRQQQGSDVLVDPGEAAGWLCSCLAAVVGCVGEFSDEGLLQLLLACVDAGLGMQQQQQDETQQQLQDLQDITHPLVQEFQQQQQQQQQDVQCYVELLVASLVSRLPRMSLLQLSRISKALEGKAMPSSSSSSSSATADGSSSSRKRPEWFTGLLQQCKAAMAARA